MLQDVNEAAHLRPLERKATGRRRVSFRKHLDDGIYITALYCKILLTFANTLRSMVSQIIQYSPVGMVLAFVWKMNGSICSKMSFRIYIITIPCLPTHNRDVDVFFMAMTTT